MYVSLNGMLGSGKSTLCKYLQENHGFEIFSTGSILRKLAKERAVPLLEINKQISSDGGQIDGIIDGEMKKFADENRGKKVIFDSRLAWYFIEDTFKVFLTVSEEVAAERVYKGRRLKEEEYATKQEALEALTKRRQIENKRFFEYYGINCDDLTNYDLVIDTTNITPQAIAEKLLGHLR